MVARCGRTPVKTSIIIHDNELWRKARAKSVERGESISSVIERGLREYVRSAIEKWSKVPRDS